MSKLEIIKNALEKNPNVVIGNVSEGVYVPGIGDKWKHTLPEVATYVLPGLGSNTIHAVCYHIAPIGGLYTPNKLNEFMMELAIDFELKPSYINRISENLLYPIGVDGGSLHFSEVVGEEKIVREITINEPNLKNLEGLIEGKKTITEYEDLFRTISIKIFPNIPYLKDYINPKFVVSRYNAENLAKYKYLGNKFYKKYIKKEEKERKKKSNN